MWTTTTTTTTTKMTEIIKQVHFLFFIVL